MAYNAFSGKVILLLLMLSSFTVLLITSDVYLPPSPVRSFFIKSAFHTVCHQQPERCIELNGAKLFVCARCTGIYAGFAFGLLVGILLTKKYFPVHSYFLLLAAIPIGLDVIAYNCNWYPYQKSIACITGFLSGGIISVFFSLQINNQENKHAK